jgi:hypothetical protein
MGTKFHPRENRTWRNCVSCRWNVQGWNCLFPMFSGHQCPYVFATAARNISVTHLHHFYTRFVHVPYVARSKPQTTKHFFQIYKRKALTSVLLSSTDACCLRFAEWMSLNDFSRTLQTIPCLPFLYPSSLRGYLYLMQLKWKHSHLPCRQAIVDVWWPLQLILWVFLISNSEHTRRNYTSPIYLVGEKNGIPKSLANF